MVTSLTDSCMPIIFKLNYLSGTDFYYEPC
jgi:hypothetical protein